MLNLRIFGLLAVAGTLAGAANAAPRHVEPADTIKLPYTAGRIYRLQLIPGSPFVVELPGNPGKALRKVELT